MLPRPAGVAPNAYGGVGRRLTGTIQILMHSTVFLAKRDISSPRRVISRIRGATRPLPPGTSFKRDPPRRRQLRQQAIEVV